MKLEIKHLAPYFPYGLKCKSMVTGEIDELEYINITRGLYGRNEDYTGEGEECTICHSIKEIKPILRPLSDFAGKRTAGQIKEELNCSIQIVHELWDFNNGVKTLEECSYELFLVMCENHIDFNKLIEEGLAIDVNTIKT